MKKVWRSGADMNVAFSSYMKSGYVAELQNMTEPSLADTAIVEPKAYANGIKSVLRPIYRLAKTVLHPVLWRTRRYMSMLVQHEVQHFGIAILNEVKAARMEMETAAKSNQAILNEVRTIVAKMHRTEKHASAAARHFAVPCGTDSILVLSELGYIYCPVDDHSLLVSLMDGDSQKKGMQVLIQRLLSADCVFIDVGANLGIHTLTAAKSMSGQGKIIAFELFSQTKQLLEKTVQINGFSSITEIYQCAVSKQSGKMVLENVESTAIGVRIVTIDDMIDSDTRVDLIKFAADGTELDVLAGAMRTIRNSKDAALIVTFSLAQLQQGGHSTQEWFAKFADLGLVFRVIDSYTGKLQRFSEEQVEKLESVDLLFARPTAMVWEKAGCSNV